MRKEWVFYKLGVFCITLSPHTYEPQTVIEHCLCVRNFVRQRKYVLTRNTQLVKVMEDIYKNTNNKAADTM